MPAPSPTIDDRTLLRILRQLLGEAGKAFDAAPAVTRWKYARPFTEDEVRQLLAQPFDDAGLMLSHGYARLMELLLQRLNGVPEKNLLAFLDAMGVELLPPSPARVPLTFTLAQGTPPTRIPRGAQAGTKPDGTSAAAIFETGEDLTVLPARLTAGFTMDPVWDRYTDLGGMLGGESGTGFTPFVGVKRMPHILFVGDDALLDFSHPAVAELLLTWQGGAPPAVERLFREGLDYELLVQGELKQVVPVSVTTVATNQLLVRFSLAAGVDRETIRGVGLVGGIAGRWLRAVLPTPLPDDPVARALSLGAPLLRVKGTGILPDLAYGNTAPLDVTKEFLPFGQTPKVGDTFYIASGDVFSKPGATVTLTAGTKPTPPPVLTWEYWNGDVWTVLPKSSVDDGTAGFTRTGSISLLVPSEASKTTTGGIASSNFTFVRARIAAGQYRGHPALKKFQLATDTKLKTAVSAGADTVQLTDPPFAAPGQVLVVEDEHAIVVGFSGTDGLKVRPTFAKAHAAGSPVILRGAVPATRLADGVGVGATQVPVHSAGGISVNDILLVDDGANPEFIRVAALPVTGAAVIVVASAPLRFAHANDVGLARIAGYGLVGYADGDWQDFSKPFAPFGDQPSPGDIFYLYAVGGLSPRAKAREFTPGEGSGGGGTRASTINFGPIGAISAEAKIRIDLAAISVLFPNLGFTPQVRLNFRVEVGMVLPAVELQWEYLGAAGWNPVTPAADGSDRFRQEGPRDIVFPPISPILAEVNGQKNYWLRVRIASGNYGLPAEFEPVDPSDPSRGFTMKAGTGNVNPPVISSLSLSYSAERTPTVVTENGFLLQQRTESTFTPFIPVGNLAPAIYADPDPALYLGFDHAFPEQPVTLYAASMPRSFAGSVIKEGKGGGGAAPPAGELRWEYFGGGTWRELTLIDGTEAFTASGTAQFLTPADMAPLARFDATPRYWVRARAAANDPSGIDRVAGIFLNTIPAVQGSAVSGEILGSGSGKPGQTLRFSRTPVLAGQQLLVREPASLSGLERAALEGEEGSDAIRERINPATGETEIWVRWHEVPNFLRSDSQSRHYLLDRATGTVTFGDGTRGANPPRGTNSITATYRTGGGAAGNAPGAAVAQIKSALPGVASVRNPVAADGGSDIESAALVRERGPQTLRHRYRAVSAGDFEWLALEAAGTRIARVRCLPNVNRDLRFEPGWVTLLVVPRGTEAKLTPGSELVRDVEEYLEAKGSVGLVQATPGRISVIGPGYIRVAVEAEVVPNALREAEQVKERVRTALDSFLHPLTGGPDGTGWEFGRDVYASEVCRLIEGTPGVNYLRKLRLVPTVAQRRLVLAEGKVAVTDLPEGSPVTSVDRRKAALLAEKFSAGDVVGKAAVKGFKEGDRITRVLDLTVQAVAGTTVTVLPFTGETVVFPHGCAITTFNGSAATRLAAAIPRGAAGLTTVVVEDAAFTAGLASGDVITVFHPFPMVVASVETEITETTTRTAPGTGQRVVIEPYETEGNIPAGVVIATLDNRVRLPLSTGVSAEAPVTVLDLADFQRDDSVTIARRDGIGSPLTGTVGEVRPVVDTVYLDDNFLVYPGKHTVRMTAA
ncbi:putative baseplate assembly protein [Geobacter sp.]|uniref:putative baseplate assembly protein n=1 Tax=Geobacter sp. TaxID=46610 RepID=UPI0026386924|nr:putative baseplate assembly protein [Geobacter sp.]